MHTAISSANLTKLVLTKKESAIVLFSGAWCPDCRDFEPTWDRWSADRPGNVYSVEVPRAGPEWKDWNLDEIPTVAAFSEGREIHRVHGTITAAELEGLSRRMIARD